MLLVIQPRLDTLLEHVDSRYGLVIVAARRARVGIVVVTPDGCENLAPEWSGTPEDPAVA